MAPALTILMYESFSVSSIQQVKNIINSKRVLIIIISVFVVLTGSATPVFCVNRLGKKFFPDKNKTMIGLVFTKDREKVEEISFAVNNVFIPFSAFAVVLISTVTLVIKLERKSKWRMEAAASSNANSTTNRDQNVAKMVVLISTLFIACFIPVVVNFVTMLLIPEFSFDGKKKNLFLVMFGLGFFLESINSSMNIFIYYRMSSRYRAVFHQIFCRIRRN